MQTQPLISVIVPVYKVEPYLQTCIDSIRNQTYKNLEVFLVDDGSPDACGDICDGASLKDPRITVIHQKNAGQSAARNAALNRVKGEYIAFVDSDDAIEEDMFDYLYEALERTQSDIALCGFKKITEDEIEEVNAYETETIFTGSAVLEEMIVDEHIGSQPCNKLFRASLLHGVRFPLGRIYEDLAMMHEVFAKAQRIICLPECKYLYTIRNDSTSFSMTPKWSYGLFKAFADRYAFAKTQALATETKQKVLSRASYFAVMGAMRWAPGNEYEANYLGETQAFAKENLSGILCNHFISLKNKLRLLMLVACKPVFKRFYKGEK